jgi:hypothetical protein
VGVTLAGGVSGQSDQWLFPSTLQFSSFIFFLLKNSQCRWYEADRQGP